MVWHTLPGESGLFIGLHKEFHNDYLLFIGDKQMSASLQDNALALNSRTYTDDMFTGSITTSSLSSEIASIRRAAYYTRTRSISASGQCTRPPRNKVGYGIATYTSSVGTSFSVKGYSKSGDSSSTFSGGGGIFIRIS